MTYALLGFGTMGRALAQGWLTARLTTPRDLAVGVRHPERPQPRAWDMGLAAGPSIEAARSAEVVVLAVKPKDAPALLAELAAAGALAHGPLLVSIVAGLATPALDALSGGTCPIVRAMPNTPCAVGDGTVVLAPGPRATPGHLDLAERLFAPVAAVMRVEERHLDTVTGLSGSGPAFLYLVMEAMAEGGVLRGLPRAVALELAARAARGAAGMVLATGRHPAELRDEVATPGGCTAAGLLALEEGRLRAVLARGVDTAARVAGELAK